MSGNSAVTEEPDRETPKRIRQAALDELIKLYYGSRFARPESFRKRAETAFTISTAAAAALGLGGFLSGLFSNVANVPVVTLWLVAIAFVSWTVSAGAAMYAASYSAEPPPESQPKPGEVLTQEKFQRAVAAKLENEVKTLKPRTDRALVAIGVSLLLTLLVLLSSLFAGKPPEMAQASLALSSDARGALERVCDVVPSRVDAQIVSETLDDDLVEVVLPAGSCKEDAEVHSELEQEDIEGIVWIP